MEVPLVKLLVHQLIMSLVHQPNRILLTRKSQDYWENKGWGMVTVPETTMESILTLRGCIRQCLSSEPQKFPVRHTSWGVQSDSECMLTELLEIQAGVDAQ